MSVASQIYMETELFDNVDYLKCVIKQRLEDQLLQIGIL